MEKYKLQLFSFRLPNKLSGSILVVSLWALAILSILGVALAGFVAQQIKFANYIAATNLSLPIAKAGVLRTFLELKEKEKDASHDYDSIEDMTKENTVNITENAEYKYYFADKVSRDGKEEIIDESALININTVSSDVISRLPGLDKDLAQKITSSIRRPFKVKEELLLVEGLTKDIFDKFKDYITVYGTGKVNINTAPKEVLLALGLDEGLVGNIINYRSNPENYFSDTTKIMQAMKDFSGLGVRQQQDIIAASSFLSVKSDYLRLNIIPLINSKPGIHYSILIYPKENKVLRWQE